MDISILGTGYMARTLGQGLAAAGHTFTFGSRAPEQATELSGSVTTYADAIAASEVVVSALNAAYSLETLAPLREALAGKILIDIGNAIDERFDLLYPDSSLAERLQQALPDTKVVKTLNTLNGAVAVDPAQLPAPTTVFLSGDDSEAKATVAGLLADLGWTPTTQIDLGPIATARATEHYFLLFASLMQATGSAQFNVSVIQP